jgi:multimeric flavodoxin WrbA
MGNDLTRRRFIGVAGATAAAGAVTGVASAGEGKAAGRSGPIKIIGVCCSPRKGMSTAASLKVCLDAAKEVDPENIEVELIELAGMKIQGDVAAGVALEPDERDDFPNLAPRLSDPKVAGIILGTPVYFSNMSSLCKAFLDRWIVFRKSDFALADKVGGVLAVGSARNGGQLMTIESVQAALYCQEMIVVGAGRPTTRNGAAVCSGGQDDVTEDEVGMGAARDLGRRVAEVARRVAAS